MTQRYAKCCLAVAILMICGLYLSTMLLDYRLTSGLSHFRFPADKGVHWVLTAVGLETNSSSEASVPVASHQLANNSAESNMTFSQPAHWPSENGSQATNRTARADECRLTPPPGVLLPNNTMYLMTPCPPPDPQPASPKAVDNQKLILVYNRPDWFHADDPGYKEVLTQCGLNHACRMTDDRSALKEADAVIVHVPRIKDRDPYPPSVRRDPRQVWIVFGMESPVHFEGYHDSPSWKGVFNWTFTYRTDSDVFNPYGFLALRSEIPATKNYTEIALNKTKPVAWFVSNCFTQSSRKAYVNKLRGHIDVDIYGACGSFKCPRQTDNDCLRLLNTTYHFYLSFENSLCRDYVTEKLFRMYNHVDVIPVVRGAADYDRYIPPNTFINAAHFKSPHDLAVYLKSLMADTEAYVRMLRLKDWFQKGKSVWNIPCQVCRKLHDPDLKERVYPDFMTWMKKDVCHPPKDV